VPIASRETCDELSHEVDEVVCAVTPEPFYAVGLLVRRLRSNHRQRRSRAAAESRRGQGDRDGVLPIPDLVARPATGAIALKGARATTTPCSNRIGDARFVCSARRRTARTSSTADRAA